MVGRDNPRVFTRSGIKDLLTDFSPVGRLNDAGFSEGDILPVSTIATVDNRQKTVSSASFQRDPSLFSVFTLLKRFGPIDNLYFSIFLRLEPGSGETVTGRIQNVTDGETVVTVSGDQGSITNEHTPWKKYRPTTVNDSILIRYEHKTEPATNSSNSQDVAVSIGVEL